MIFSFVSRQRYGFVPKCNCSPLNFPQLKETYIKRDKKSIIVKVLGDSLGAFVKI
jgi:hypothetical protein